MHASYGTTPRKTTGRIGARLSPRRKAYAQRLLDYLWWNGGKLLLDQHRYHDLSHTGGFSQAPGLDRFAVDQAVDDLYALGLVEIRMAGDNQSVTPLAHEIDAAPELENGRFGR